MRLQSEQLNELAAALAKAQGEMSAASKDSANPFFKSKYADLSSVWEACRLPLSKNGLSVSQPLGLVGETGEKMALTTLLMHSSGQWVASTMVLPSCPKPQELGSVITYYRRYALAALVGVYQADDDAELAQRGVEKQKQDHSAPVSSLIGEPQPKKKISEEQCAKLDYLLDQIDSPVFEEELAIHLKTLKVTSMYDMSPGQWIGVIKRMEKELEKQKEADGQSGVA